MQIVTILIYNTEGVYLRRAKVAQPENVVGTPLDPGFR